MWSRYRPAIVLALVLATLYFVMTDPGTFGREIRRWMDPILYQIKVIIEAVFGSG